MNPQVRRWRCVCAYDGTDYAGWQSQVTGNAIQDLIECALEETLGEPTRIHGSGRTDAGVHAMGQVFHFDGSWKHGGESLRKALCTRLPQDVRILHARESVSSFHARISAKGKRYLYRAIEGSTSPMEFRYWSSLPVCRLDLDAMRRAAAVLVGERDYSSFSVSPGYPCDENPVKNLWQLDVRRTGKRLKIKVEGSGFLYKMVRSLCGALFDVGRGRLEVCQVKEILEAKKRTSLVVTAAPQGLCLEKVFYRKVKSRR